MLKELSEHILDISPTVLRNAFWLMYSSDDTISSLRRLSYCGFAPALIIDGGAFRGVWTRKAKHVFPNARVLMIEAQESKHPLLTKVCKDFAPTVTIGRALLGPKKGTCVPFYVMGTGSSVLPELSNEPRHMVTLETNTLDNLIREQGLPNPSLIKLDLQGYEVEALKGAEMALRHADVVFLEVSVLPYNLNAPLCADVTAFMSSKGFVPFDFCNLRRRHDGVLFQMDTIFVRQGSQLWQNAASRAVTGDMPPGA
jgi:FkbM family methyltransferase